jgi:hypothetical protein
VKMGARLDESGCHGTVVLITRGHLEYIWALDRAAGPPAPLFRVVPSSRRYRFLPGYEPRSRFANEWFQTPELSPL